MDKLFRQRVRLANVQQPAKTPKHIERSSDHSEHRDGRPGYYAVVGPFIKLPDHDATDGSDE